MAYLYLVESRSLASARLVLNLLQTRGVLYRWQMRTADDIGECDVRISVSQEREGGIERLAECTMSGDPATLARCGVIASLCRPGSDLVTHLLIDPECTDVADAIHISWPGVPVLVHESADWQVIAALVGASGRRYPLLLKHSGSSGRQIVLSTDIAALLDSAVLGPNDAGSVEDWASAYEPLSQQSALRCPIEQLIANLLDGLRGLAPEALPVTVTSDPPGRTAPLLVTGDSDDASPAEFDEYLSMLEDHGIAACLLLKEFRPYGERRLRRAIAHGHAIGLHPYSESGSAEDFASDFQRLAQAHADLVGGSIAAVRNHRFQRTTRVQSMRLENEWNVGFDLNSVAVADQCWIGSASGVALPTPFCWPMEISQLCPLHLPTVVEDDVFMFSHDYCYRLFEDGDSSATDVIARFLDMWILHLGYPAVVNYHPEHVRPHMRRFLESLCQWARSRAVWTPSTDEFGRWLKLRAATEIEVRSAGDITITTPTDVVVRLSRRAGERYTRRCAAGVTDLDVVSTN